MVAKNHKLFTENIKTKSIEFFLNAIIFGDDLSLKVL